MNLDKLFIFFGSKYDKDNLGNKVKIRKPISKKTFYHAKNSVRTYILLPPWHSVSFVFYFIKKKLKKMGFSYIEYNFSPSILSPDVGSTAKYFEDIEKEIGTDMKIFIDKHGTENFVIIGLSLSCVIASMISGINSRIQALILVVPGSSLAESLWRGIRTMKIKNVIKDEGISLTELKKDWEDLAPENHVNNFKNKKVRIYISKSDKIIPYNLGKKFSEEAREILPDTDIRENKFLGHYGTVLDFCMISKDIVI